MAKNRLGRPPGVNLVGRSSPVTRRKRLATSAPGCPQAPKSPRASTAQILDMELSRKRPDRVTRYVLPPSSESLHQDDDASGSPGLHSDEMEMTPGRRGY